MCRSSRGEHIAEIKQKIRPAQIDPERAGDLGATSGNLALAITRRYLACGGTLIQLSRTLLPADRVSYTMMFLPD